MFTMFIMKTGKDYRSLSLLDTDHTYLFLAQVTGPRLKLIRTASIESIEVVLLLWFASVCSKLCLYLCVCVIVWCLVYILYSLLKRIHLCSSL